MQGYSTVIEKLISSAPSPNTDGAYAEVRRGAAEAERTYGLSVANPALSEYVDLYIDKKNGEHPVVRYQNLNSAGETQTRFLELYNGTTNKSKVVTDNKQAIVDLIYPVGSYMVTKTNSNPSSKLGGSWTLRHKNLSYKYLEGTSLITFASSGLDTSTLSYGYRQGDVINLSLRFTPTAAVGDTKLSVGTLNLNNLGVTGLGITRHVLAVGDSAEGAAILAIDSSGNVSTQDFIGAEGKTTSVAGETLYANFTWSVNESHKIESHCDQFFWERTA